jgi:hypothetical protein
MPSFKEGYRGEYPSEYLENRPLQTGWQGLRVLQTLRRPQDYAG